jgi:transposase InsO family protein
MSSHSRSTPRSPERASRRFLIASLTTANYRRQALSIMSQSPKVRFSTRGRMRSVRLSFNRPGKPVQNAYIESFNGKFRDEFMKEH